MQKKMKQNKYEAIAKENNYIFVPFIIESYGGIGDEAKNFLSILSREFNISIDTGSVMGGRKHSAETLLKFKTRKVKKGKEHYCYGTKLSEERKLAISKRQTGAKRSELTKKKQSDTNKRLNRYLDLIPYIESNKCKIIDSNGIIHDSLTSAAKYYNISVQAICDNLKGRSKKTRIKNTKLRLTFKYV